MNIAIFTGLTTDDHLNELKAESEKYTGLYVDMNETEQRKYVKEKADSINQLLKKLDRARIDLSKNYKSQVEKEAADIKERLEIANLPFTLLIDEHKAERKKVLDAEKARKQAILDAEQLELDHEMALLMNDKFDADKAQAERERVEHEEKIKTEAIKAQAEQAERDRIAAAEREEQAKQDLIDAEAKRVADVEAAKQAEIHRQKLEDERKQREEDARLSNVEYVRGINNQVLEALANHSTLPVEQLKMIVRAIARNEIPNVTINY